MPYKLVCSDIDGTLLNKDRELSPVTIQEVQRIAPIPFVLISSRMPAAMRHLQQQFGNETTPMVAYNGGLILDNERVLHSCTIENNILETIIEKSRETEIHLSLYYNDEWYVPTMDYWANREASNTKVTPEVMPNGEVLNKWRSEGKGAHKIMAMGPEYEIDALYDALHAMYADAIHLYRSKNTYIEISHKSISKKTAIATLLEACFPECTMEDVVAFGDNYNDIEMLKAAGLGVAMGNAKEEVIVIADSVTESNKHDGVAIALSGIF